MPAVEAEELQRAIAESLRLIGDGAGTFLLPTDVGTALIRGREVLAVEAVDVPVSHPRPGASAALSPLSLAGRRPAAAGR